MAPLSLSVATWDYDRVRALMDGRVKIEGCEINYIPMPVEEVFHRAYFHTEFDIAEIGFSPFLIAQSRGIAPYTAVPAFLSRTFRHSAVYIRTDRGIDGPADLKGKRIGVPEYQMSAVMWFRGVLKDEHGIEAADINWVQAGLESAGREDKFPLNLPPGFPLEAAPKGRALSEMLAAGEVDALMSARAPSCFIEGHPKVRRLFPDFRTEEKAYYKRTGIFPIMHAVGIRNELVEKHPWLPASVYKAFAAAKKIADAEFREVAALKIGLPWLAAELESTIDTMGEDFWPYGVPKNRVTLDAMARYSYEQGLAVKLLKPEDMFASTVLDEVHV
jgi:4,5-dihydroxyphthalate decarboxylase